MVVSLCNGAGLGGEGEGNLVAVGLSENNLNLVNGVGSIFKLGNVEALLLLDVLADNFGELDGLGDAGLDGLRGSDINVDNEGCVDKGDGVLLGLVFVLAKLVLSGIGIRAAISGSVTSSNSHGLALGLRGHLCGGGGECLRLADVCVCADFLLDLLGGFLTDCPDLVVAVVIINNILDSQDDGGGSGGESGHAHLSVDGCVCFSAVCWGRSISIGWGVVGGGKGESGQKSDDEKDLHVGDY